jgi:hypothetical protein
MHSGDGRKIGQFSGVDKAPQQTPRRGGGHESGWGVPNVQNTKLFLWGLSDWIPGFRSWDRRQ